jgi:hypothetical protein
MPVGPLEYIELFDFTPGIWDERATASPTLQTTVNGPQSAPEGAARNDGTFGCYGGLGGGLFPLPAVVETFEQDPADFQATVGRYHPDHLEVQILDTFLMSPVGVAVGIGAPLAQRPTPDQLFVGFQWFDDADDDGQYRIHNQIATYKQYQILIANTRISLQQLDGPDATYDDDWFQYGYCCFDSTRHNNNSTTPGFPHVVWSSGALFGHPSADGLFNYPSTAARDTDSIQTVTSRETMWICAHQGRIVAADADDWDSHMGHFFGEVGAIPAAENISYTDPNSLDGSEYNAAETLFVEENPTGYGVWQSVNASELLLIKHRGGGVVVRGDVARPTVVRAPGLPSTYNATNKGVMTDIGFVFGTRYGVWSYNGGEQATLLSPNFGHPFWQLEEFRFENDDEIIPYLRYGALQGRFGHSHPFVFTPNNYVYDTRVEPGKGGWYRLADPAAIRYTTYHTSYTGDFYALPSRLVIEDPIVEQTLWDRYSPDLPRRYFSWNSHPLQRSRGRFIGIRELQVLGQGVGTVTITITDRNGATVAKSFVFSDEGRIVMHRNESIRVEVFEPQIKIESNGTGADNSAPVVWKVRIGYRERGQE